jgi:hypothetical protein
MVDGSDNSVVRGLVINQFPGAGIAIYSGADGIKVKGNYIGTDPTGLLDKGNFATGITTVSSLHGSEGPDNVVIGGVLAADRNIVSANNSYSNDPNLVNGSQGIAVVGGSDDWVVQGNYIGVGANGTTDLGNELGGMTIDYIDGILIGGDTPGAGNVVSGNGDGGIQPDGVLNLVMQGNYIGTDYTGSAPLPNATKGVTLAYGTENALIGGTTPGAGNIIAYNPAFGINAWQAETQNVTIIGNSIHDNTSGLGIDLSNINSEGGLTINDALDQDAGANNLLNFPDNVQYKVKGGNTDMTYTLDVPAGQYRVEFFSNTTADGSGFGEGETYLGSHDIVKTGSGSQAFAHTLTGGSHSNISATATLKDGSADGFGPTSEFSATATERADVTDASLTKTILNPGAVSAGGTIEYQLTMTNNGLDDLDLTQFDNPLGTAIISDFLDPDLTPVNLNLDAPGPLPGSFYLSDVGNPDLTCLWGGPGSGAGVGLTTYGQYSFVICIFTGAGDTTLEADESLSMTLDVSIAGDSDMVFTNYALAAASLLADPDNAAIGGIFGVGGDYLELLIANQASNDPINNFASAAYPLSVNPGAGVVATQPSPLAAAGTNENVWLLIALALITSSAWLARKALIRSTRHQL